MFHKLLITVLRLSAMKEFYTHNLTQSPMQTSLLRALTIPLKHSTALDAAASSTKTRGSEILTRSIFSDIGNDCLYSSNLSPPLPNSSLAVPRTGRIRVHESVSVDYVMLFSWVGLAAVSFLVAFFNFPRLCEKDVTNIF